jgi:hypothetical protein
MKITSIEDIILPRRFISDVAATEEDMEKKTRGTMAVNRRFRNTSPKGLQKDASFLRVSPNIDPINTEKINNMEKP